MFSEEQLKQMLEEFRGMPVETECIEFKKARTSYEFDKLGRYFSALSNEANLKNKLAAWLVFGVNDSLPREIVGSQYKASAKELDSLKHAVAQKTNGCTFTEIYELHFPAGRVVMFQIPAAPAGIPTSWEGHYYGRDGESLGPLSMHELETIRSQSLGSDWSAEICPDATVEDLDEDALNIAKSKFLAKHKLSRFVEDVKVWDAATFLEKAKLTRNGRITRAAILLLGKQESAHHVNPHPAQITWKLDAEEKAYEHFGPPFLLSVEEVFRRIRNVKFRIQPFNHLIPVELTKYEPKIVLEALNNCIAHQDYLSNGRIVVTEKTDRLILENLGGFYDGTVEDYVLRDRTPMRYRNPFLTQAMVNLDMIDTMGMGIRRMFIEQRRRFFPMPEYDLNRPDHVAMTIYGKMIDVNYSRILMEDENLGLPEVILLDRIQKELPVDQVSVKMLRKLNLVEGRYPNIFVSALIAKTTGNQVDYTKHRAFDKQYYEDLVIKFLDQHKEGNPADFKRLLFDKLSDVLDEKQKRGKIRNLLQDMSQKGLIHNIGGHGLGAKWRKVLD